MNEEEIIYSIALTQVPGIGATWGRNLLQSVGSAVDVFQNRTKLLKLLPGISSRIVEALNSPLPVERAKREFEFVVNNQIQCLTINDENYPSRLRECNDAPIVLFYRGSAGLNGLRVINMVGTRNATDYGKQLCNNFLKELKQLCPDLLVVSGLAYGIDIHAHRAALSNGLDTVGVLAHGLDRIYPSSHRKTAVEMLSQGGLLTEFLTETNPDRHNFVSRNRIVAGMSDATIVVESASKGGSLITAELAGDYHRECFAFPGRVTDEFSAGCNQLIRENKASLIQSAEDFVMQIGWNAQGSGKNKQVQLQIFPDLSEEERLIVSILEKEGPLQINQLVIYANMPVHKVNALLFELEMNGVVKIMAGGMYQLL